MGGETGPFSPPNWQSQLKPISVPFIFFGAPEYQLERSVEVRISLGRCDQSLWHMMAMSPSG